LGGVLQHVLATIRMAHQRGTWVEVVTLIVPGFNDSEAELREAARFLASVSPDIPWHVTAFHPDYRMRDRDWTPAKTILRAAAIGREEGLRYVYVGNLPGAIPEFENTYCPSCRELLVERSGYQITASRVTAEGRCPRCGTAIPGIWR
ncbi:MAG: radical SAM protein, partial [Chloroflexota bacterium]|nr:radical SAM protein [Chloroflexota bacterium]